MVVISFPSASQAFQQICTTQEAAIGRKTEGGPKVLRLFGLQLEASYLQLSFFAYICVVDLLILQLELF